MAIGGAIHYQSSQLLVLPSHLNFFFENFKFQKPFLVRKRGKSQIWPYLANLPKSFDNILLNWPSKYDEFLFEDIRAKVAQGDRILDQRYRRINYSYNSINSQKISKEEFLLGYWIFTTRNVEHNMPVNFPGWFDNRADCGALAPIYDLWNHNPDRNCRFKVENGGIKIRAIKNVNPGEELFNSYGDGFLDFFYEKWN